MAVNTHKIKGIINNCKINQKNFRSGIDMGKEKRIIRTHWQRLQPQTVVKTTT